MILGVFVGVLEIDVNLARFSLFPFLVVWRGEFVWTMDLGNFVRVLMN